MTFNPTDKPLHPGLWKPNHTLVRLALRRCECVHTPALAEFADLDEAARFVVVSCYYQGLADGIKHMARKQRALSGEILRLLGEEELASLADETLSYRCGYRAAAHRICVLVQRLLSPCGGQAKGPENNSE